MRILIVEDEEALALGVKFNLEEEGYDVIVESDGGAAVDRMQIHNESFDMIVMDLMLPGMSGYEACRRIRQLDASVPILVLSARSLAEDKTVAFDCGCDQYMTKPFDLPELISRVRNLLQRRGGAVRPPSTADFGRVTINFERHEVEIAGEPHSSTSLEFKLLCYFFENQGRVLSRAELLEAVWGEKADISTRTVDNFVLRLRKLIEENPADPKHILSVRGTGYRFESSTSDGDE